jgi:hypothetical protein
MSNQYALTIIDNAGRRGVPLDFKGETFMVYKREKDYRVVTAYYSDLVHTGIYKLITPLALTFETFGDYRLQSLAATLDVQGLDILIARVDKIGRMSVLNVD